LKQLRRIQSSTARKNEPLCTSLFISIFAIFCQFFFSSPYPLRFFPAIVAKGCFFALQSRYSGATEAPLCKSRKTCLGQKGEAVAAQPLQKSAVQRCQILLRYFTAQHFNVVPAIPAFNRQNV
jgi:hypothetical protein